MNPPRQPSIALVTCMVLAALAVVAQWRINSDLRREIDELNGRLGVPWVAPADTGSGERASSDTVRPTERAELARLRAEVDALKERTQALTRIASARAAETGVPLNLTPASAWKNAGKASPSAAAETLMWATDGADWEAIAASIFLDPAAREKAEAIRARLPESSRALYDTPEKLVALLMAREGDVQAMQILGENRAASDALVNLRTQKGDGKTKEEGLQFKQTTDGWKLVVTGKAVDKYGKKLTEPPKQNGKK